ncbi:MAG TPA: UvrD-helicase domain-containing protein, partial [Chryseosolibacter sp.]|nr:UvrD-helicase domain-containing protein [Chryseosolibacter sp.]
TTSPQGATRPEATSACYCSRRSGIVMEGLSAVSENDADNDVDDQIGSCLSLDNPISFFLFAGAGSGKTRSLVKALQHIRSKSGIRLRLHSQKIGVITYTNAACDEINQRLDFDSLIEVRTIHSFIWTQIQGLHADIKKWLKESLHEEIAALVEKNRTGRAGTKTALEREKSIESKKKRLDGLDDIVRFTYNPNGDNRGRDSLNHSEVIKIGADFLTNKSLMQTILVSKFPILLIDESQDTNKLLMDAFLRVQAQHHKHFCLGLFGDTMQRIYADGKVDLGKNLPVSWAKPVKKMNHRCPHRIVKLINKIRFAVDEQEQTPRTDKSQGCVRLFILPSNVVDKVEAEQEVRERMARVTNDERWTGANADVKCLLLEHHMAARRMGFWEMFEPLYQVDSLKTGLLDGSLAALRIFSQLVLPLVKAKQVGNEFVAAAIVRKYSPLLDRATLKAAGADQLLHLRKARSATEQLMTLWSNNGNPLFVDILGCIVKSGLFEIPESLHPIAYGKEIKPANGSGSIEAADYDETLDALEKFIQTPFAQIEGYSAYVNGMARFDTHQGVKGREFSRVFVVMDDDEARGFLFSYEKLFGAKDKTSTDLENELARKETGIDRTRRLFYVICSRAKESLALVAYSSNPSKIRDHVIRESWFEEQEVEILA